MIAAQSLHLQVIGGVVARTPELMGIGRASIFLGVDQSTLRRWTRGGEGPPRTRKGKRFYYVREVLKDWLKANAPAAVAPALSRGPASEPARQPSIASRATLLDLRR